MLILTPQFEDRVFLKMFHSSVNHYSSIYLTLHFFLIYNSYCIYFQSPIILQGFAKGTAWRSVWGQWRSSSCHSWQHRGQCQGRKQIWEY